jgi:hypothetical protein
MKEIVGESFEDKPNLMSFCVLKKYVDAAITIGVLQCVADKKC